MEKLIYFIRKTSVAIIFIVLEIVAIYVYAFSTPYTQAKIIGWTNSVAEGWNLTFAGISNYFVLREENEQLTERIAMLENQVHELEQYKPKEQDSVITVVRDYEYIAARVVTNSTQRARNYFTIDKGTQHGVSADMAVLTPDGSIAGVVVDCSENYSVAKSILNIDFYIGGTLPRDGSSGSVHWSGKNENYVDFDKISKYASVSVGDLVLSAGFSHYFPPKSKIGVVEEVDLYDDGASYSCRVRLSADMARLYNVILVNNVRSKEAKALEDKIYKKEGK